MPHRTAQEGPCPACGPRQGAIEYAPAPGRAPGPRTRRRGQGYELRGSLMMKRAALAFSLILMAAGIADAQQTPRRGGTIRMTAPYGTNISTMDMHTTPRAQDDIYGHVVHRTL